MINLFGQQAIYYCGGWNCRHRWVPVNEGKLSIESGRKSKQNEIDSAQALVNAGMDVHLLKESKVVGKKSFDSLVNSVPAEFKEMTDATTNQSRRVRDQFAEALKQGAEHFVLSITKTSVNLDKINDGIMNAILWDKQKKIKQFTVIISKAVQTIKREEFLNGKRVA